MKRILVAEDEKSIRDFIIINLKKAGYDVVAAADGAEALQLYDDYDGNFDIALLDIMMPKADGMQVCAALREKSKTLGIVMLTAKTQEMDKVMGLLKGADDYITKPFSLSELLARIDAIYRRVSVSRGEQEQQRQPDDSYDRIELGEFILHLRGRNIEFRGQIVELTQMEFNIMEYFFKNPNVALDRDEILRYAWGEDYYGDEKVVDVNVRRLRMKIEEDPSNPKHLLTVWGLGYKWIP